jgi:hypothetical protein
MLIQLPNQHVVTWVAIGTNIVNVYKVALNLGLPNCLLNVCLKICYNTNI